MIEGSSPAQTPPPHSHPFLGLLEPFTCVFCIFPQSSFLLIILPCLFSLLIPPPPFALVHTHTCSRLKEKASPLPFIYIKKTILRHWEKLVGSSCQNPRHSMLWDGKISHSWVSWGSSSPLLPWVWSEDQQLGITQKLLRNAQSLAQLPYLCDEDGVFPSSQ